MSKNPLSPPPLLFLAALALPALASAGAGGGGSTHGASRSWRPVVVASLAGTREADPNAEALQPAPNVTGCVSGWRLASSSVRNWMEPSAWDPQEWWDTLRTTYHYAPGGERLVERRATSSGNFSADSLDADGGFSSRESTASSREVERYTPRADGTLLREGVDQAPRPGYSSLFGEDNPVWLYSPDGRLLAHGDDRVAPNPRDPYALDRARVELYRYDPTGRLAGWDWYYKYPEERLSEGHATLTYDPAGRLVRVTETSPPGPEAWHPGTLQHQCFWYSRTGQLAYSHPCVDKGKGWVPQSTTGYLSERYLVRRFPAARGAPERVTIQVTSAASPEKRVELLELEACARRGREAI
jgi:hypothetical protein